jgi:hypothetical protein
MNSFVSQKPARYIPFEKGVYEVAPGLRPLHTDFGNGSLDNNVFQIDSEIFHYLDNKAQCRCENIHKYCLTHDVKPAISEMVNRFLAERMVHEYPEYFKLAPEADGFKFSSSLTGDEVKLSSQFSLIGPSKYIHAFDALSSQVPEDIAIISLSDDSKSNMLNAIHLCAAGHWSPASKIGKDFFAIHAPVAEIQKINNRAQHFAEIMVHKGPFVRFAWGFSTDTRLNHHPEAPTGVDPSLWHGRSFKSPSTDRLYIRVERQVIWGFPQVNAALFTIRVSFIEGEEIRKSPILKDALISALQSMTPASRAYKGLDQSMNDVLDYLNS